MKTIVLKKVPTTIKNEKGETLELDYRENLQTIMRTPSSPQAGADYEEIRKSLRVLDILDATALNATSFQLEDADYEYLRQRVKSGRYIIDKAVMQFIDDVTNVK